jgi:hypothetical protein
LRCLPASLHKGALGAQAVGATKNVLQIGSGTVDSLKAWCNKEAWRIAQIALCVPEELRGEYIALRMTEGLLKLIEQEQLIGDGR